MALTRDGGKPNVRDVRNYATPTAAVQHRQKSGLGGNNLGNSGTQGPKGGYGKESGSPGLGGTNHGNDPSENDGD